MTKIYFSKKVPESWINENSLEAFCKNETEKMLESDGAVLVFGLTKEEAVEVFNDMKGKTEI